MQDYAVVIELIDDSATVDLWAETEAEAGAVFRQIVAREFAA
jgi:hypothetical protein